MINQFFSILRVIGKENRLKAFKLLIILLLVIVLELLNLSLIIPILTLIFSDGGTQNLFFISFLNEYIKFDTANLITIGQIFLFIIIFKIFFLVLFEYKTYKYCRDILIDVYLKSYSHFLYSSWKEASKQEHSYIIRNILSDTGQFVMEGVFKFILLIKNTFFLLFITTYLFFINFKITLILLIFFILFVFFLFLLLKNKLLELSSKTAMFDKLRIKYVYESILNLRDIKLNMNYDYYKNLFKSNENKVTDVVITSQMLKLIPRYSLELLIIFIFFIFLIIFDFQNYNMVSLIPIIGLYSFALLRMMPIFITYNKDIQTIKNVKFQIDEVIKNIERYNKIDNENILFKKNLKNDQLNLQNKVNLKITNLSFFYSNSNDLFKNINLEINTNETVCLEGPNGSGKSTFVDLISGLLKPTEGKIEINGLELNFILDDWLKNLGYVSQSNFLTNDTIKDNIIFGRKNISEDKILETLKIVELDKLIKKLPKGINTNVGSLGNFFSGGQKQRIAIARALVKNPKVIILDEATNALDKQTENNFLEIIDKIKKDKIVIFIAHSETIKNFCDINLIINNKKIEQVNKK
tara:strand:- start:4807 stop:6549 length:1743 start_codon:yes stop_codon:yes gene_type:complete